MNRIKQRWDIELPQNKRMAQSLVDNARRFEREIFGTGGELNIQGQKNMDWTFEMKTELVKGDDEEGSKGRGLMKRVKERLD